MNNSEEIQKAAGDEPAADFLGPAEAPPTLEQLLDTIRKLGIKIEELTETRRILKKQAEGMLRKL